MALLLIINTEDANETLVDIQILPTNLTPFPSKLFMQHYYPSGKHREQLLLKFIPSRAGLEKELDTRIRI